MSDEELIDGIYREIMVISSGSSSQVLEVAEQQTGRHVAMKLLKNDAEDFKDNKVVMKQEAAVMKTLEHPLIIKFERFSTSRDYTYIIMEHFRASNVKLQLKTDMKSMHIRARRLFEGVCSALSHVHSKGWIHRDIKPDNVLINKVGEIRLVDFSLASKEVKGFAKMMGGGKQSTIQGTRTYIAPETIRKQPLAFQTDIYSLGILFFEVLTGRTPFQAPTPEDLLRKHLRDEPPLATEFNKNITPEMDRLMQRMLKKKIADRPASVDEVLGELRRIRIFVEDVVETTAAEEEEKNKSMDVLTDIRLDSRADAKLQVMLQANPELARQFEQDKQAKSAKKKADAALVAERAKKMKDSAKPGKGTTGQPQAPPMQQPMMPMPMPGFMPQPQFPQFAAQPPFGMAPGPAMMPMAPGMPPAMAPGMMPGMGMPAPVPMGPGPAFPGPAPGFPQQPAFGPGMSPPGATPGMSPGMPPQIPQPQPGLPAGVAPPAPRQAQGPAAGQPAQPAKPAQKGPAAKSPAPSKPAPQAKPPVNPDEMEYMTELPDIL